MKIVGIQGVLPNNCIENRKYFENRIDHLDKFLAETGFYQRYVAKKNQTLEGFVINGVNALLKLVDWKAKELDYLITISQTSNAIIPSLSATIGCEFDFKPTIVTVDLISGCSGFVEGLQLVHQFFLANPLANRAIICCGDFSNSIIDIENTTVAPIFSDGIACIAIERSDIMDLNFISRQNFKANHAIEKINGMMEINGLDVFLNSVSLVNEILKELEKTGMLIDRFYFHQANKVILKSIVLKAKLETAKTPINIEQRGNLSSASIPFLLMDDLINKPINHPFSGLLCGFGVGFKVAAVALVIEPSILLNCCYVD